MITTDQGRTYIACGENDPRPYEIINTGVGLHVQIVIWARSQLRCNVVTLSLENKKVGERDVDFLQLLQASITQTVRLNESLAHIASRPTHRKISPPRI